MAIIHKTVCAGWLWFHHLSSSVLLQTVSTAEVILFGLLYRAQTLDYASSFLVFFKNFTQLHSCLNAFLHVSQIICSKCTAKLHFRPQMLFKVCPFSVKTVCKWTTIISLSFLVCSSTVDITAEVILLGLPKPLHLLFSSYYLKNFTTSLLLTCIPSY